MEKKQTAKIVDSEKKNVGALAAPIQRLRNAPLPAPLPDTNLESPIPPALPPGVESEEEKKIEKIYLSCHNMWKFQGSEKFSIGIYETVGPVRRRYNLKTNLDYENRYKYGIYNDIDGYIFVFGAKIDECNGLYDYTISKNDFRKNAYANRYMKYYTFDENCNTKLKQRYSSDYWRKPCYSSYDDEQRYGGDNGKEYLKFSRKKGIKIVPKIDKYIETDYNYSEEEFDYVYESPKDDDSIANLRWDLIQSVQNKNEYYHGHNYNNNDTQNDELESSTNKENINLSSIKAKLIPYPYGTMAYAVSKREPANIKKRQDDYYQSLLNIKSFNYKYLYRISDDGDKLIGVTNSINENENKNGNKNENENENKNGDDGEAFYYFIRDFAFDSALYPKLVDILPKNYKPKSQRILDAIGSVFNNICGISQIVFDYLFYDICFHENDITYLVYDSQAKYYTWWYHTFVCDLCEEQITIPNDDNETFYDQLSFVMRVKRSFGKEYNGRKDSHRNELHSYKVKKWIYDKKFNGMTHVYTANKNVNIYKTDQSILNILHCRKIENKVEKKLTDDDDQDSIGVLKQGNKICVIFCQDISIDGECIVAIRTENGLVGFILIFQDDIKSVSVKYSEIEQYIKNNNIIISKVRVNKNENPIDRIKYSPSLRDLISDDDV